MTPLKQGDGNVSGVIPCSPAGGSADRRPARLFRGQRAGDIPGSGPLVSAERRRHGHTGSDVSGASAAHDADRDAERGATVGSG